MTGPPASFRHACDYLFPRANSGTKWSLEPTRRLLNEIGNPQEQFASVHIAGTNGKGSVAAMVYAALRDSGRSVGLYTSPHLVHVAERIIVDQRPIGEAAFAAWTARLHPVIEDTGASFFEATTAIAFADFAARGVDIAVVEVGLGGRLDSTNVIQPLVAAVTNIGLDHTDYLGDSLTDIAREKAGVAKAGTPLVVGERSETVVATLREVAIAVGAKVIEVPPDASYAGHVGLQGEHQRRNAAIARQVLESLPRPFAVADESITYGIATAWLPGRLERRGRWVLDVAHNLPGMETLVAALHEPPPKRPLHVIFGVLKGKDADAMLRKVATVADAIWITLPPSAPMERRADPPALDGPIGATVQYEPDFDRCILRAAEGAATVVVTGSFHTVGDAMSRLPGFNPFG